MKKYFDILTLFLLFSTAGMPALSAGNSTSGNGTCTVEIHYWLNQYTNMTGVYARIDNCDSMNLQLDFLWSTGDTTQYIEVAGPGTYCVTITATLLGTTIVDTYTGCVDIPQLCSANIVRSGNTLSYQAYGSPVVSALWSTGETGQSIETSGVGNYSVTLTHEGGCSSTAHISLADTACYVWINTEVNNDNTVTLTAFSYNSGATYIWSNGATGSTITVPSEEGSYCVTLTNPATGCEFTNCIEFGELQCDVYITATQQGTTDYYLTAIASGGSGSYLWNTGEVSQSIVISVAGNYSVTFTDSDGCYASASYYFAGDSSGCNYNIYVGLDTINGQPSWVVDTANLAGTYLWSDGTTGPILYGFDPNEGYWLFYTGNDGCEKAVYVGPGDPNGIVVTGDGSIEGIVYSDPHGLTGGIEALGTRNGEETMAGVAVILEHPNGAVQTRMTGSDGQYRFEQLAEGNYRIRFVAGGRAPYEQDIVLKEGTDRLRFNVVVGQATILGSDTKTVQQLTIFPNPATDAVTVLLPAVTGPGLIQVVDMRGHVVAGHPAPGTESRAHISLHALTPGTYMIRTIRGDKVYLAKVIRH